MRLPTQFTRATHTLALAAVLCLGLCSGCSGARHPRPPATMGSITVSLAAMPSHEEIPDVKVVFRNAGTLPREFPDLTEEGLFWGRVIVRCDDSAFVLRLPAVWDASVSAFVFHQRRILAPGAELTMRLALARDFVTLAQFTESSLGEEDRSRLRDQIHWRERVKACTEREIYCVTDDGLVSNVIKIGL